MHECNVEGIALVQAVVHLAASLFGTIPILKLNECFASGLSGDPIYPKILVLDVAIGTKEVLEIVFDEVVWEIFDREGCCI